MSDVTVIHLVRKANGIEHVANFLEAHWAHTDVTTCDLVLACKGFGPVVGLVTQEDRHVRMHFPDCGYDLGTYRRAAELVDTEFVCFLNSFSRPLVKGWLDIMLRAAREPLIGLVGCTGSWEGIATAPFPNPHVRTNAFLIRRELFLSLEMPEPHTKDDALQLEAGPNGITRQIERRGLTAVVVNAAGYAAGYAYHKTTWVGSDTFRMGNQHRLLVADNRTDHYQNATPDERAYLRRLAWGSE